MARKGRLIAAVVAVLLAAACASSSSGTGSKPSNLDAPCWERRIDNGVACDVPDDTCTQEGACGSGMNCQCQAGKWTCEHFGAACSLPDASYGDAGPDAPDGD
jgi:hypothetical protein